MSIEATRRYRKTPKGILTNIYNKQIERSIKRKMDLPSYSLREFHQRFLNSKTFMHLFTRWAMNGFKTSDKPSIDRIDCLKPYSMDNIQILTWKENRVKGNREQSLHYKRTEVWIRDLNGKKLKLFNSIKDAVRETGCHQGLISAVCQGKRSQTGGFKWSYGKQKCVRNTYMTHENPSLLEANP